MKMNTYDLETQIIKDMVVKLPLEICEMIVEKVRNIQDSESEVLYTCEHCGRVWDGNAQCFPCNYY